MADEDTNQATAGPVRMTAIATMMNDIKYKGQLIARTNKLESGIMNSGMAGFIVGLLFSLILVVPVLFIGGI